jgi:hypothetical protein
MSNLSQYFQTPENPYDEYSIEEIDFELELIDTALENFQIELDLLGEKASLVFSQETLSIETVESIKEFFPSFEDYVSDDAGGGWGRMWDDWLTTRRRLVAGILDAVRSKKSAIKAYRKKLTNRDSKIDRFMARKDSQIHTASFVSMEKYWLYANNSYPKSIIGAVLQDLKESQHFLNECPKIVLSEVSKLIGLIKGGNYSSKETIEKSFLSKLKTLKSIEEIVGPTLYGKADVLLYKTIIISTSPEKHQDKSLTRAEILTKTNRLTVITGDTSQDTINALITLSWGLGPIVAAVPTALRQYFAKGFTISTSELKSLVQYGHSYLDTAESCLDKAEHLNSEFNHLFEKVVDAIPHQNNSNTDHKAVAFALNLAVNHTHNLSMFIGKPMQTMINRNIKVAKGIFYLVTRTIGRPDRNRNQ